MRLWLQRLGLQLQLQLGYSNSFAFSLADKNNALSVYIESALFVYSAFSLWLCVSLIQNPEGLTWLNVNPHFLRMANDLPMVSETALLNYQLSIVNYQLALG